MIRDENPQQLPFQLTRVRHQSNTVLREQSLADHGDVPTPYAHSEQASSVSKKDGRDQWHAQDSKFAPQIQKHFNNGYAQSSSQSHPRAFIRHQLKAWYTEQEKESEKIKALSNAPPNSSAALPNSLFLEDPVEEQEEEAQGEDQALRDSITDDENAAPDHHNQQIGDVVFLRKTSRGPQYAIFLGTVGVQCQYFLANGNWFQSIVPPQNSVIIPDFISIEQATALRKHLPTDMVRGTEDSRAIRPLVYKYGDFPRSESLVSELISKLLKLRADVLNFKRDHYTALEKLHDTYAHEHKYIEVPVRKICADILGHDLVSILDPVDHIGEMAISQYLSGDALLAVLHCPRGTRTLKVLFKPKSFTRSAKKAIDSVREYQDLAADAATGKDVSKALTKNPLNHFIEKARRLILHSRKSRLPTTMGALGPMAAGDSDTVETVPSEIPLSATDHMFVELLWDTYVALPQSSTRGNSVAIAAMIIRAIGAYPNLDMEGRAGRLLLQELGVLSPWYNRGDEDLTSRLPGRRGSEDIDDLRAQANEAVERHGLSSQKRYGDLKDAFEGKRHDFGELPVYCIDDPGTKVIDDGFSFEPCVDKPDQFWVHIHIANPAAFFDPDHIFARGAQALGTNVYHLREVVPMLPWIVSKNLSVTPDAACLTTSVLLSEDGEITDICMRPTIVRNVVFMSHYAVNQALGKLKPPMVRMVVGHSAQLEDRGEPPPEMQHNIEQSLPTLRKLQQLVYAHADARVRNVAEPLDDWTRVRGEVIQVSNLEPLSLRKANQSHRYIGDPAIDVQVAYPIHDVRRIENNKTSWDFTGHIMSLACEASAKWLADRKIPAVFVGSEVDPSYPINVLNSLKKGELAQRPVARASPNPSPHVQLHVSQYSQVTSPLRRYRDLICQWQICAYLQLEMAGKITNGSPVTEDMLPWSSRQISEFLETDTLTGAGRYGKREQHKHWVLQALFRAIHFKAAKVPEIWDVEVSVALMVNAHWSIKDDSFIRGDLLPFYAQVVFLKSSGGWEYQAKSRQKVPVKVEKVDIDNGHILVRAVGPPSDEPTIQGSIDIRPPPRTSVNEEGDIEAQ